MATAIPTAAIEGCDGNMHTRVATTAMIMATAVVMAIAIPTTAMGAAVATGIATRIATPLIIMATAIVMATIVPTTAMEARCKRLWQQE